MKVNKICPECGTAFWTKAEGQECCSQECRALRRGRQSVEKNRERAQAVLVKVVKEIPVYGSMRPQVGAIYPELWYPERVDCGGVLVIPKIGRYGLIVRRDEAEIVGTSGGGPSVLPAV